MPRHLQGSWEAMCCRQNPPLMDDGASTQMFPKHLDTHLPWEFTILDFKQLTEWQPWWVWEGRSVATQNWFWERKQTDNWYPDMRGPDTRGPDQKSSFQIPRTFLAKVRVASEGNQMRKFTGQILENTSKLKMASAGKCKLTKNGPASEIINTYPMFKEWWKSNGRKSNRNLPINAAAW